MLVRVLLTSVVFVGLLGMAASSHQGNLSSGGDPTPSDKTAQARATLLDEYPGVKLYEQGGRITRLYGTAFGSGRDAEDTAEQFRSNHAAIFGVEPDELDPRGPLADQRHTQDVMYDRDTGLYRFTLVYYGQYESGIPVFRSNLRLLVRNDADHSLVLASSTLRDLGDFTADRARPVNLRRARNASVRAVPGLVNFTEPRRVIWAGVDDMVVEPTVGVEFVADNGQKDSADYAKWLFVVDAATGRILHQEDQVLEVDVVGNVSGMATEDIGADICEPESLRAMAYARVNIGGTNAFGDVNGDFVIPNGGNNEVTVQSPVRGRYFRVFNQSGPDTVLSLDVIPPGPANFVHNAANNSEFIRAEVNGYVEANRVRDAIVKANPNYPVIGNQLEFTVNVNQSSNCNATYSGDAINFRRAGSGCSNTANSTIVHHEYGHHLVETGGSGQGQYGEGTGDTMGVILTDQPVLALGFSNNCNAGIRNADNNLQYPCNSSIHFCGQLLSGSVWDTRNELVSTEPVDYSDILMDLMVNSVLLHGGQQITPQITVDWLTLDDDNNDIFDGTPHSEEICTGFGVHNMDCPNIDTVVQPNSFTLLRGGLNSGALPDLYGSDDDRLSLSPESLFPLPGPPIQLELRGNSPDDAPSELVFRFEGRVNLTPIDQRISLFNYDTQSYEEVDVRTAPTSDTVIEIVINNNPTRFVEMGTGEVKALVIWDPEGLSILFGSIADVDQSTWILTP
ncbi:MAG: hypothetical protein ACYS0G_09395 [Planctomycetota bacterium]|jgi:hypothetical protein